MKKIILLVAVAATIQACTKVITPKLNNAVTQIVIQGAVSDTAGPYYVSITRSVGFYEGNVFPPVSGAIVSIADNTAGTNDVLSETSPGMYITHSIQGIHGDTYSLKVMLDGQTYTATCTMPMPVALDSVSFEVSDTTQVRAQANFKDPAGTPNFYRYSITINGVYDKRIQAFSDRLSDGRYIRDKMDNDTMEIRKNDMVALSLIGIDKNTFTYFNEAAKIAYSNASLAAPATPTSNITGGCLGYFSAQTVSTKKAVVKF